MRLQQLPLSQQNMISHSLSWLHIEPNAPERRLLDHASGCASQPPKNQEGQEAMGNKQIDDEDDEDDEDDDDDDDTVESSHVDSTY